MPAVLSVGRLREEAAHAAGLMGIARPLGVVIQCALLAFGRAQSSEVYAETRRTSRLCPEAHPDATSCPGQDNGCQAPQSRAPTRAIRAGWRFIYPAHLLGSGLIRIDRSAGRTSTHHHCLSSDCAPMAAFFAAARSFVFSPDSASASALFSLALAAASVVSGIAPSPSF